MIVTIFPDSGDKYLSEHFWERTHKARETKHGVEDTDESSTINCGSMAKRRIRMSAAACWWASSTRRAEGGQSRGACGNTRTDSPANRYHISPSELVRIQRDALLAGHDIVGFYHSHPDHPAQWSATDLAEAHWTGCSYVITSVEKGMPC